MSDDGRSVSVLLSAAAFSFTLKMAIEVSVWLRCRYAREFLDGKNSTINIVRRSHTLALEALATCACKVCTSQSVDATHGLRARNSQISPLRASRGGAAVRLSFERVRFSADIAV